MHRQCGSSPPNGRGISGGAAGRLMPVLGVPHILLPATLDDFQGQGAHYRCQLQVSSLLGLRPQHVPANPDADGLGKGILPLAISTFEERLHRAACKRLAVLKCIKGVWLPFHELLGNYPADNPIPLWRGVTDFVLRKARKGRSNAKEENPILWPCLGKAWESVKERHEDADRPKLRRTDE